MILSVEQIRLLRQGAQAVMIPYDDTLLDPVERKPSDSRCPVCKRTAKELGQALADHMVSQHPHFKDLTVRKMTPEERAAYGPAKPLPFPRPKSTDVERQDVYRVVSLRRKSTEGSTRSVSVSRTFEGDSSNEVITIFITETRWIWTLTFADAKVCGYRTTDDLRDAWRAANGPAPDRMTMAWVKIGDHLDEFRGMRSQMGSISDYTSIPSQAVPDEALKDHEYSALGMHARQATAKRKADTATSISTQPLAVRMRAIEAAGERMKLDIKGELYVITQRVERAERYLEKTG